MKPGNDFRTACGEVNPLSVYKPISPTKLQSWRSHTRFALHVFFLVPGIWYAPNKHMKKYIRVFKVNLLLRLTC